MFRFFRSYARLLTLEEKVSELERKNRDLELEWDATYEKLRSVLGRLAKRAKLDSADAEGAAAQSPEPTTINSGLSPNQARFQEQILRRRGVLNRGA